MSTPLLLAFETATRTVSVALLRGAECVDEEVAPPGRPAAEVLLPALDALLARAGASVGEVDAYALSIGPGSFTSLRVGLATVKGLAFGSATPIVPVPTLAALALAAAYGPDVSGAPGDAVLVPVLDARRGELYAAAYRAGESEPLPALPEGVYTPDEIVDRLRAALGGVAGRCVLTGEGLDAPCAAELPARLGPAARALPAPAAARHVGALGARLLAAGATADLEGLAPRYLRRPQAEEKRTGERFE